jgi:hypothetical protein
MYIRPMGLDVDFFSGTDMGVFTLFPTDADGYPVVGPEPFSIEPDYTELGYLDMSSSTGGAIGSLAGLVTFSSPLPGDFNSDNVVDAADYVVWRKNPSAFGGDPAGYNTWRSNFGRTSGSGLAASANPVPEPAGITLCVASMFLFALRRRRK